jgi:O-antigen/teichoic acid export membrane protein
MLTVGEGISYGSSFIRNMILARVLTKADFGIAATFSMVIMLLEFSAKLGIARFVVRDKEGNEPSFVAAAHVVQAIVAVASAGLMVATSPLLAKLFAIPDQSWAIASLAGVALLRAFQHLDVRRFEREMRFMPSMLVEAVPQLVMLLCTWPVAVWFGDFRAVLVLLLAKAVASCIASHVLAEYPYRWEWHREFVMRMLRFGWPLVVNGFLMFGILQGEQFLVASFYSMADLAPYAAAVALVTAPTFMFGRVFNAVSLPVLSKVQDDGIQFQRRYRLVVAVLAAYAAASSVGLAIGAEALMHLVYGPKYAGAGVLMACLAAMCGLRTVRMGASLAALARGDSENEMWANGSRLLGLAPALIIAFMQEPVWMLACCGILGECLANGVAVRRLLRRDQVPTSVSVVPICAVITSLVVGIGLVGVTGVYDWPVGWAFGFACFVSLAVGGMVAVLLPETRKELLRLLRDLRPGVLR